MARVNDAEAAKKLAQLLRAMPEDLVETILRQARQVPPEWKGLPVAGMVRRLRRRFDMTQRQLAALSGLTPAKVAMIEAGQDVRVSTLFQIFAGFGCGLVLLPASPLSAERLWRRSDDLYFEGYAERRRRWPRK